MVKYYFKQDLSAAFLNKCLIISSPKLLTVEEVIPFHQECIQLINKAQKSQKIILDLSNTHFLDSSSVGALVSLNKIAIDNNCKLILQQVDPSVLNILELSGGQDFFYLQTAITSIPTQCIKTHSSVHSPLKRLLDIVGAMIGLVITAIIYLPIAIAIKIDSPGSIFFSQTRCGCLGKRFTIWKFRSMYIDAEKMKTKVTNQATGPFFKNDQDPRVTKVGRFLRRASLDELPQFWNVIKGDMSLVGTRPPTPNEVEQYQVLEWQRLNIKPGMTGEWQVKGRSKIRKFEDVIALDLRYQKNWSLIYDLQLIFQTILLLFSKDSGAI